MEKHDTPSQGTNGEEIVLKTPRNMDGKETETTSDTEVTTSVSTEMSSDAPAQEDIPPSQDTEVDCCDATTGDQQMPTEDHSLQPKETTYKAAG